MTARLCRSAGGILIGLGGLHAAGAVSRLLAPCVWCAAAIAFRFHAVVVITALATLRLIANAGRVID
jgi:hypothetical protein